MWWWLPQSLRYIPQRPRWGVLTVSVKARCLVEVVSSVSGQVPVNLQAKWFLWNVHVHFDCKNSHKTMSMVVAYGIFRVNFDAKWLLRNVHVHFECAGSHETVAAGFASGIFLVNFQIKWLLWHIHMISTAPARTKREISHRHLAKRSLIGSLYKDLANRALFEILCRDLARRPLIDILYRDLVKRAAILLRDLL